MEEQCSNDITLIQSVSLDDEKNELVILDQSLLPNEKCFLRLCKLKDICDAIYQLKVRGAPAIGIAAAYGAYLGVKASNANNYDDLYADFINIKNYLAGSRPTAVNLFWALGRMDKCIEGCKGKTVDEVKKSLKEEAESIRSEDEKVCESIGKNALPLLQPGWGILTHCNAGTIATAKFGTALAPIYLGNRAGYYFKVYADETRPLLQGARLTAWELMEAGADVTLICDNMASIVMKEGRIQAVLAGCDRIAANGDTANKIGTLGVAIIARHYNIPFYVCSPLSTIDLTCSSGADIHIEIRKSEEITDMWYKKPMAPAGVQTYNPCFDVTDSGLISAIVTEKGIAYPPYNVSLARLFK